MQERAFQTLEPWRGSTVNLRRWCAQVLAAVEHDSINRHSSKCTQMSANGIQRAFETQHHLSCQSYPKLLEGKVLMPSLPHEGSIYATWS